MNGGWRICDSVHKVVIPVHIMGRGRDCVTHTT